ncbi:ABC transporter permease [Aureimonas endophytica]|uniref:ABC transporter permease n=1 Tax=Aureimonas endophytica TaxID=2027858 RepID=A0A917EC10_9HYPH|nr:ABC transporter permease subunit [Aureimonas endophytica]GGE22376.1 ABC transporter permease [Aureimonas endophytica]
MDLRQLTQSFDTAVDDGLIWLQDNATGLFDGLRAVLDGVYESVEWCLAALPFWAVAALVGLVGWRTVGTRFGAAAAIGLVVCAVMGLWPETMATLALVLSASLLALAIAIPAGILAGYNPRLNDALTPVLDMIQTLPPYIYLLPAIALLGFGPATALAATVIVAVPPALRLTALGIRQTPLNFLELGRASGTTSFDLFAKIRLPFAMPSIMAGVNQCLMMAFGMVVIAGIVGSGGLGATIYDAVRTLDIGKSIDGGIAIVILTMVLDRITEGAVRKQKEAVA